MSAETFRNWRSVRDEVLKRIHARDWKPGDLIPAESELAKEFGCARATVNRALRSLAEDGLLDRRRKTGTRVAVQPVTRARLDITVIRQEIESRGQLYGYKLLHRKMTVPSIAISTEMQTDAARPLLHLKALHLSDHRPFALEDRWINRDAVPDVDGAPFQSISANEWLLAHVPYTHGRIAFSATAASASEAKALSCRLGSALFVIDRLTWDSETAVTKARLLFAPGHQLQTEL